MRSKLLLTFILFSPFALFAQDSVENGQINQVPEFPNYIYLEEASIFATIKKNIVLDENTKLVRLGDEDEVSFSIDDNGKITSKANTDMPYLPYSVHQLARGWYQITYLNPHQHVEAFFATGSYLYPGVLCREYTANYVMEVRRDGELVLPQIRDYRWYDITYYGTFAVCGSGIISLSTNNSALRPGEYTFTMTHPNMPVNSSSVTIKACAGNPLPLYTSRYNGSYHNTYMSVDDSLHRSALSQGYANAGITAKMERKDVGSPYAKPFNQYFNQSFINHYYGWKDADIIYVLNNGWRFERQEGTIYDRQLDGTVPLYDLWKNWNGAWDVEHRYTTSTAIRDQWVREGFNYNSIMGYVCP